MGKYIPIRHVGLTVILLVAATPAKAADISHCISIEDATNRLACYDDAAALLQETPVEALEVAPAIAEPTAAESSSETPMADRIAREEAIVNSPFALIPHYRNYILPVTYNSKINEAPFTEVFPGVGMDDIEAKFQISFKVRAVEDVLAGGDLWFGYTQQSWWQVYNDDESAPFRETNFEPEALLIWDNDWNIGGFTNSLFSVGFNHQSNGRGNLFSRSWNRITAAATFERQNFVSRVRLWHRIKESKSDDDNPNMDNYYGRGDLMMAYQFGDHEVSALIRNNLHLDDGNKGALQLDWSYPLSERFNWYVQYFYGYGESLIDYNVKTNRIGVGISMNNMF